MAKQWEALLPHRFLLPCLILHFPPISQKHTSTVDGLAMLKLPLGVNECVSVCAWWPVID